ncbi:MAG: YbhB/YbcL family Raf kinase inhibitor-like protein [Nanoarchaeota archaeon]
MRLHSPDFGDGGVFPTECSQRGGNEKPKLSIQDPPPAAKTFALTFVDLDKGGNWCHWVVWNIPATSTEIKGEEGTNSTGNKGYSGPNPELDSGVHRYVFTLYALKRELNLQPSATKQALEREASAFVVDKATLRTRFGRPKEKKKEKKKVNWS